MPFIAVLAVLLFFIAALGQTFFWRNPTAGLPWYGGAAFCWAMFFLSIYIVWPTLKALGV